MLKRRLLRLVWVYTYQNVKLLEIPCCRSILVMLTLTAYWYKNTIVGYIYDKLIGCLIQWKTAKVKFLDYLLLDSNLHNLYVLCGCNI